MHLIDPKPKTIQPINGDGWCFIYGEQIARLEMGAVYLLQRDPHYTRFKVVEQDGLPVVQPINTRPLTAEEIAHFERLVQDQPKLESRQTSGQNDWA